MQPSKMPELFENRGSIPVIKSVGDGWLSAQLRSLARKHCYALMLLLCLGLYLPGLFALPTLDRDEAYFAEGSRDMLISGDFVIPHYLDRLQRKPPGIYWMQALSAKMAGAAHRDEIWPYRIPSLVGATAAALLTCWIGTLAFDAEVGLLAGALFAASFLTVVLADMARPDAALLACVTLGQACVAALYCGRLDDRRRNAYAAGFWLALGFGILIKGPVQPFVSGSTICCLWFIDRRYSRERAEMRASTQLTESLFQPWAIVLSAAILMPWLAALASANDRCRYLHTLSSDFFPKLIAGVESHWAPPLYHVLLAAVMFWPGSLFLATAVRKLWHLVKPSRGLHVCIAWLVPTWVVAELIPTKLPPYVLPAYPALAILVAWTIRISRDSSSGPLERAQAVVWTALTVALGVAGVGVCLLLGEKITPAIVLFTIVGTALALWCGMLVYAGRLESAAWFSIASALVIFGWLRLAILPNLDSLWLSRKVSAAVTGLQIRSMVTVGYEEPSLVFALGSRFAGNGISAALDSYDAACGRAILVSSDHRAEFLAIQKARQLDMRPIWSATGFNYSKGQWVHLMLFRHSGCPSTTNCPRRDR